MKKIAVQKPQVTTNASFILAAQHFLGIFGSKTPLEVLNSIPSMTVLELSNTFVPIIIAMFLYLFNEDKEPEVKYVVKKKPLA